MLSQLFHKYSCPNLQTGLTQVFELSCKHVGYMIVNKGGLLERHFHQISGSDLQRGHCYAVVIRPANCGALKGVALPNCQQTSLPVKPYHYYGITEVGTDLHKLVVGARACGTAVASQVNEEKSSCCAGSCATPTSTSSASLQASCEGSTLGAAPTSPLSSLSLTRLPGTDRSRCPALTRLSSHRNANRHCRAGSNAVTSSPTAALTAAVMPCERAGKNYQWPAGVTSYKLGSIRLQTLQCKAHEVWPHSRQAAQEKNRAKHSAGWEAGYEGA